MSTTRNTLSLAESFRVLAVDDDPVVQGITRAALEEAGFEVWLAASAEEALARIEERGLPHLAVVDIVLPGMSGLDLCRQIQESADLPIIVLTSVNDLSTKVEAIDTLAEDYVTKPFEPAELVARVRRLLRRVGDFAYALGQRIRVDERLEVEFAGRRAYVKGRPVELTPTESKLLYLLMRSSGRTLRTDYLLRRLWPFEEVYEESLRTHVWRLRKKIEASPRRPRYVVTRRGLGYSFRPES